MVVSPCVQLTCEPSSAEPTNAKDASSEDDADVFHANRGICGPLERFARVRAYTAPPWRIGRTEIIPFLGDDIEVRLATCSTDSFPSTSGYGNPSPPWARPSEPPAVIQALDRAARRAAGRICWQPALPHLD